MQLIPFAFVLAAVIVAQPLVDGDVLEPSVQNEVDHALVRVPNDLQPSSATLLPFATNGMSHTEIAVRLVSEQRSDGHWRVGTNDVTAAAVQILRTL